MNRLTAMLIMKAIVLQLFWFLAVFYGPKISDLYVVLWTVAIVAINFWVYRPPITIARYLLLLLLFSLYGIIQDGLLSAAGIISFSEGYYPFWLNSLYLILICYYGDLFNALNRLPKYVVSLLGGIGGSFAYHGGSVLGGIEVTHYIAFLVCVFIGWGLFLPISFFLFYQRFSVKADQMESHG